MIFLSLPAVWLAWYDILLTMLDLKETISVYVFGVLRTGSVLHSSDVPQLSPHAALGVRISITGVFVLGLVCIKTLSRYGSAMDKNRFLNGKQAT
jgi:hypothetical protein